MKLKKWILLVFFLSKTWATPVVLCDISMGFALLNQQQYSKRQMDMILSGCDTVSPQDAKVLLLHGLVARHENRLAEALDWLKKAHATAPNNAGITLELAGLYELIHELPPAKNLYQSILMKDPNNRAALLGEARIARLQKQFAAAAAIYQQFLLHDPHDVEALNGLAFVKLDQNDLLPANNLLLESLKIRPNNPDALRGIQALQANKSPAMRHVCNVMEGLRLVNQSSPPVATIQSILALCQKNQFDTLETRLLHGLLARHEKQYAESVAWLQKAMQKALPADKNPQLELAVTWEWAKQPEKALTIYDQILATAPDNKAALTGKARLLRIQNQLAQSQAIYEALLKKNPADVDAMNGLGWIALTRKEIPEAKRWFESSLKIQSHNEEAEKALKDVAAMETFLASQKNPAAPPKPLCDANEGMLLLNKPKPDFTSIQVILKKCDRNMPNDTETLMLHALLARYQARHKTGDYADAIRWFELAVQSAKPDNQMPILELATTWEWANQPKNALAIYQQLLTENPDNTAALLGKGRVLRTLYMIGPSVAAYEQILYKKPREVEALNGLGETFMVNYQFKEARSAFNRALTLEPHNKETAQDLRILNNATKNILAITGGHYAVPPKTAQGVNLFYFRNLSVTDSMTLYAMHNNRQIESGFGLGPTLLPNNSLLIGYQHQLPYKYGWELSYDGRQHNSLPFENRAYGAFNFFINNNIQSFSAVRLIFPYPWNTQLYISGVTLYTNLPFNITTTGFWSFQQIGGKSSSYALDFSKEFANRLFYDIGASYLPVQHSPEVHGRLVLPILKDQALVAEYSHYLFNNSTFATAGWRFYWA